MCLIFPYLVQLQALPVHTFPSSRFQHQQFYLQFAREKLCYKLQLHMSSSENYISSWFPLFGLLMLFWANTRSHGEQRHTLQHHSTNRSNRYGGPVTAQPNKDPTNAHPGGTRRGRRTLGYSRFGRPARTSSNATETKEEQHVEVGKVG
jgi:hypothetical protein